jgi:hypothetical protein
MMFAVNFEKELTLMSNEFTAARYIGIDLKLLSCAKSGNSVRSTPTTDSTTQTDESQTDELAGPSSEHNIRVIRATGITRGKSDNTNPFHLVLKSPFSIGPLKDIGKSPKQVASKQNGLATV